MFELSIFQTQVFYIALLLLSSICVFFAANYKPSVVLVGINGKRLDLIGILFVAISYVILLLPLVNRSCGTDTDQYYRTYISDDTSGLDFTFYLLCKCMHSVIKDPQIGLGIISAITLLLAYYAFWSVREKNEMQYAFLAYYTGIYFYLYNYMRMMVAAAIVMVCYACLLSEKKVKALVFAGIAVFFHRSAIVVLLMILIIFIFEKRKKLVTSIGLIAMAALISSPYFFLSLITVERYSAYLTASTGTSVGLGTTLRILPMFVILFVYRKYKDKFPYTAALYLLLANLGFSFLGYFVGSASRLSNMYFVFHLVGFMPWLIKKESESDNKKSLFWLKAFFICYCVVNYYQISKSFEAIGILPYTWYW